MKFLSGRYFFGLNSTSFVRNARTFPQGWLSGVGGDRIYPPTCPTCLQDFKESGKLPQNGVYQSEQWLIFSFFFCIFFSFLILFFQDSRSTVTMRGNSMVPPFKSFLFEQAPPIDGDTISFLPAMRLIKLSKKILW